jgi:hypothetical protein
MSTTSHPRTSEVAIFGRILTLANQERQDRLLLETEILRLRALLGQVPGQTP